MTPIAIVVVVRPVKTNAQVAKVLVLVDVTRPVQDTVILVAIKGVKTLVEEPVTAHAKATVEGVVVEIVKTHLAMGIKVALTCLLVKG